MCDQLKISMQVAIDQFNEDLEKGESNEEPHSKSGEQNVKRIAKMFKDISMQEEGMKFYTNFIMTGQHSLSTNQ